MKLFKFLFLFSLIMVLVGCNNKTYTITFETNGGDQIENLQFEKNDPLINLPIANRTGYNFEGWYLDQNLSTPIGKNTLVNSNMTLYAKWSNVEYTVKFMDGSVELASSKVSHGNNATPPANPTKVGHEFKNWDKAYTNVTSNLVINAVFEKISYEVIFKADGEQIGEAQMIKYDEAATAPQAPEKVGYVFKDWDKAFNKVTANLIVNAVYELKTFDVQFVDHDGFVLKTQKVFYNTTATAPDNPTREGYLFLSWDKSFDNVTENLIVTALYEKAKYEVKFMFGSTQLGETQLVEYLSSATAPTEFPNGYNFVSWSASFNEVTDNLVIYATLSAITYSITYMDGTSLVTHNPATYTVESAVTLPNSPKTGHIFVGWYLNSDFSDEVLKTIPKGSYGNVTLYGKWLDESNRLNIVYELNGGSFTWTSSSTSGLGIDSVSNLPEIFMVDFYTYLKDNNLLSSTTVASAFRKSTWATFSVLSGDPLAVYNKTTGSVYTATDGYSQFFYTTATGNNTTGELLTIEGGFFGTEPYKTKYANLVKYLALMQFYKYPTNLFWSGAQGKSGAGFILDGYFYNTQGVGTGNFATLRKSIPNTNVSYIFSGTTLVAINNTYPLTSYVNGLEGILSHPSREGYVFGGWYTTSDFSGSVVTKIPAGQTPAEKYYAKWILASDY